MATRTSNRIRNRENSEAQDQNDASADDSVGDCFETEQGASVVGEAAVVQVAGVAEESQNNGLADLLGSLGMNKKTVKEIQEQQFETMEDFATCDASNFKHFFKDMTHAKGYGNSIRLTAKHKERILNLHRWVQNRQKLDLPCDATLFTPEESKSTAERTKMLADREKSTKDRDIEPPEKFKSFFKWEDFHTDFERHLSRATGASACPLTCAVRDESDPGESLNKPDSFHSSNALCVACVKLSGSWYEADNARVWNEVKTACVGTAAWAHIKAFEKKEDGRSACMASKSQGMTSNSKSQRVNAALSLIRNTVWTGPKQHFTFDDCVARHVKACNELEILNAPRCDIEKMREFLDSIQDPRTSQAKHFIAGSSECTEDFVKVHSHMQKVMNNQKISRLTASSRRRVSSMNKGDGKKFTGKIEGKHCPPKVFHSMSKDQKAEVMRLRNDKKRKNGERRTSSTGTEDKESGDDANGASHQFGSAPHIRKKARKDKE